MTFDTSKRYRLEVRSGSVSEHSCDIVIYQEKARKGLEPVEFEVRRLSFFRRPDGEVWKLGTIGKLPMSVFHQCRNKASWAMNPSGPLLDELSRRKTGEITDELLIELSYSMIEHYRQLRLELNSNENLLAQVITYLAERELSGKGSSSPGLVHALCNHLDVQMAIDKELAKRTQEREQQHQLDETQEAAGNAAA